jgi:hypothetical protein
VCVCVSVSVCVCVCVCAKGRVMRTAEEHAVTHLDHFKSLHCLVVLQINNENICRCMRAVVDLCCSLVGDES